MTKLTFDPAFRVGLNRSMELVDAGGQTVGYFLTSEEHERLRRAEEEQLRRQYARAHALFTDERLDAANRESGE